MVMIVERGDAASGSSWRVPGEATVPIMAIPRWKRTFDIVAAGLLLLLTSPILIVVALITLTVMGRPLLYRQARGGLGGTTFKIMKLRTMSNARSKTGELLSIEERREPWGDFLRRTSLDELPALINILRGDMTVVGPRPLMAKYLDRYNEGEARRHCVTPGLTGLAQTQGRNTLSWAERFDLDLEYVKTRSLRGDLRILWDTVKIVVTREGADGNDHCTEFLGSPTIDLRFESVPTLELRVVTLRPTPPAHISHV